MDPILSVKDLTVTVGVKMLVIKFHLMFLKARSLL